LAEGTAVAHKTGTIETRRGRRHRHAAWRCGHVVIAVFVKSAQQPRADRERAIAEIARSVHDFFLFVPR
jgi:beta-lactamase class A